MSSFNISYWLTSFGTPLIKENALLHSYLKVVLVVNAVASLEGFTFFLLGLSDLNVSAIFKFCFEYFSKDSYMSKNVVKKIKPIISSYFLYTKKKSYQQILQSISQNFLFKQCASLIEATNIGIFDSRSKKFEKNFDA